MPSRMHIDIRGIVQGVGFRPFVYNLAEGMGLTGRVNNSAQGVTIEAEGEPDVLLTFVDFIHSTPPPHARITQLDWRWDTPQGFTRFAINDSSSGGQKSALLLPDLAICPDCLCELFDPQNRRYRYPFINCTHCGPRYTIIRALPYDRANTTMGHFTMCETCQREYDDPTDRRFHAQPNACPDCGPKLTLLNRRGETLAERDSALLLAAEAVRQGQIVACKGLGGFHLMVDARNQDAVLRLRERKRRPDKPFATLFPSLDTVHACCQVNEAEAHALMSSAAPIVLLRLTDNAAIAMAIASAVAPDNPYLGVMLPYTPLHALLMHELGFPIVATSGNRSDEPICVDNDEALHRLGGIVDIFLMHDRPIERPVDDSVVQIIQDEVQVLRVGRGRAPLSLNLSPSQPSDKSLPLTLAVGAHLKNTIAIGDETRMVLSQHIGDLETSSTFQTFQRVIGDFERIYEMQFAHIAHDLHPDYCSTQFAQSIDLTLHPIQHHIAHVLAGIADNEIAGSVLGVAWDGTGYGLDRTIWGGEWFVVKPSNTNNDTSVERVAWLLPFPLPGGEVAIIEPRRSALGALYAAYGAAAFQFDVPPITSFDQQQRRVLGRMIENGLNTPQTSSMGRLFDAVASLLNLRQISSFEGQAATAVEFAAMQSREDAFYPFDLSMPCVDWRSMLQAVVVDILDHSSVEDIAARFLNTLVEVIVSVAETIGEQQILLTGGCFQNRLLTERAINRLYQSGFTPYWHHQIPPNDGGIAVGQLVAVARKVSARSETPCV